jgi:hypothetical protein
MVNKTERAKLADQVREYLHQTYWLPHCYQGVALNWPTVAEVDALFGPGATAAAEADDQAKAERLAQRPGNDLFPPVVAVRGDRATVHYGQVG